MAVSGDNLLELLKQHFGFEDFRPGQRAIINNALAGQHSLVVMPTGGGKSLCYQLPALALGGLTLVVSPLIALMKDQVDALRANGIPAEFLNSSLDNATAAAVERRAQAGSVNLLYVAPERVSMPGFRRFLRTLDLKLIAIDEAHCISEWGHDFRPDYRALSQLRAEFPDVPLMALTATATQRVREDIVQQLAMDHVSEFVSGFDRPNLAYRVHPSKGAWDELLRLVNERTGQSAIIYCMSRRDTEELADRLSANGHLTAAYHAGLNPDTRRRTQEQFIDGEIPVVAATIAFGMGIDKPDVRLVVHYTLPKSIEGYYQETGRAGRDGLPSECVLFFSDGDQRKHDFFMNRIADDPLRRAARQQLQNMVDYGRLNTCRRKYLLEYFGDAMDAGSCGNCDVCLSVRQTIDVTVVAQKLLSAVIRTGQRFGIAHVIDVLLGNNRKRVRDLGHDGLSVFGIVNDYDPAQLRQIAGALVDQGLLIRSEGQYATIGVTDAGRKWLQSRQDLTLELRVQDEPIAKPATDGQPTLDRISRNNRPPSYDNGLFEALRTLRRRLADEQGVPAFVVFNDATLRDLAAAKPTSTEDMLRVSGVGPAKLVRYSEPFLSVIREFVNWSPLDGSMSDVVAEPDLILKNQIKDVLHTLDDREALILQLRYGLDNSPPRTLAEIGRRLGLSRERIRQIEARALRKVERRSRSTEEGQSEALRLDQIRKDHPRAYEPWTEEEEGQLEEMHLAGASVAQMSSHLGRLPGAIKSRLNRLASDTNHQSLSDTHALTHQLLQQGLSITEIADERDLTASTVLAHVERIVSAGESVNLDMLLPMPERVDRIREALKEAGYDRLSPVKELLGDDYSYEEIRLVRLSWCQQTGRGE